MGNEVQATESKHADPDYINDGHWGKGGRYIFDPATGKRIPAPDEEAMQPAVENTDAAETVAAESTSTTVKGKRNG